jgi:hypothetical protein
MQKNTRYLFVFLAFCLFSILFSNGLHAQIKDSTIVVAARPGSTDSDSVSKKHYKKSKPDQAALMSAIIPGLGQIGHHDSWWHVPVIYAGFAAFGYGIYYNNSQYQLFKESYTQRLKFRADNSSKKDPYWNIKNDDELLANRDDARRDRDLLIMVSVGWYAANIIDAYVAAHLKEFDISNKLSMRLVPVDVVSIGNQAAFTCGFRFSMK